MDHLKHFDHLWWSLPTRINEDPVMTGSGIYTFLGRGHLYLGRSEGRLRDRVHEQLHLRRWATELLMFPFPELRPDTVQILEKRLLRHGARRLRGAVWDNQRGLSARSPDPYAESGQYPALDALTDKVINIIGSRIRPSWERFSEKLSPTHTLGTPDGLVYGVAAQRGGWTYLLPCSHISSHYPNYCSIKQDPVAFERLEGLYRRGLIAWRPRRGSRPPGLVFTEPVRFRSRRSAARVLYVGETVTEAWEPIIPKWKA
jgi:hypothetical protein